MNRTVEEIDLDFNRLIQAMDRDSDILESRSHDTIQFHILLIAARYAEKLKIESGEDFNLDHVRQKLIDAGVNKASVYKRKSPAIKLTGE